MGRIEEHADQGGAHAGVFIVFHGELANVAVGEFDGGDHAIFGFGPFSLLWDGPGKVAILLAFSEEFNDGFDGLPTGDFARVVSSHAVCHDKEAQIGDNGEAVFVMAAP